MRRALSASFDSRLPILVAGALSANLVLALAIAQRGPASAAILAALPGAGLAFGALTVSRREIVVFAALALNMSAKPLNVALVGPLYVADFLVALAFGAWLASAFVGLRTGRRPQWPNTPVLGWPLLLLAAAVVPGMVKGNEIYGTALFGQPLRLVVYAGIGAAVAGADPRRLYRGIVLVFYLGTVWMFANAVYHLASGTSQTEAVHLATGGERVVAGTVSLYLALALFLALVNLTLDRSISRRLLHVGVGGLAAFGTVISYTRAVYIAVALLLPLVLLLFSRLQGALASVLPFLLPFIAAGIIYVPRVAPDIVPTFVSRVTSPAAEDPNVIFRRTANEISLELVRESPVLGAGFGGSILFTFNEKEYDVAQGSHNSYLWLLTGGGALAFGAFVLLLLRFSVDALRRLRGAVDPVERALITWAMIALAVILVAAAAGPLFASPSTLLTIWVLLLLPAAVPRRAAAPAPALSRLDRRERHASRA